ncbi:Ubiquitin carboxyl-terminal hydrolase [Blumeria hordei DH14]|uniref:ubiquitinyl hydrolase 1 n=1 Tax=Blumeria graminis f. sp. hordei (strain DH14) TaxID=546991 RepID=N1JR08_BLUG1|nr:Ubiquitin carboxyl-terminal hydrolase [Blumeria hordei DH14]
MNPLLILCLEQIYSTDIESPSDMLVDSDELINDVENEKDDGNVHDILPDEVILRGDDVETMRELVLPPIHEQPEILENKSYSWQITDWTQLPRRHRSPVFWCGGHPWRILMFPKGNNVDYCSVYLEHGYEEGSKAGPIPQNFTCCMQFGFVLYNPDAPTCFVHNTANHRFTKDEGDWGFTRFVELRKLWNVPWDNQNNYLAPGERAILTAYVRHVKDETGVLWHNFQNYDSKQETGYVGLKNQGATCYLNSLIQSLYFTNAFRKAVYQIPTQNEETLTNSAYTLQRLFYQLQTSKYAVGTSELTKSFGWETRHIFEQQDVQELSRKLMERMEEKMKGTEAEKVLSKLFSGKVRTYISCINVDYESHRLEDFWDIQLNVSGNRDLETSFQDYIQEEIMDGENQYMAGDEYKLQDAKKGVIFETFPDVLHLQLKRFQYDVERDAMMKINDRYEFPEKFDASPYLADNADKSEPYIYQLHGVLVHSGDLNAGHYYAFIKPEKNGWFYKYDDDKVTRATIREVLEDNYGGEFVYPNGQVPTRKNKPLMRQNNAYMLVYIRQTRLDDVLFPVTKDDTPAHLQYKLDEEAKIRDARKKEREEQHLYLVARVITENTLREHGGTDLAVINSNEWSSPGSASYYRLLRKSLLKELILQVAHDTDVDPRRVRMWAMVGRQNKTVRPDQPIHDINVTMEEAYQKMAGNKNGEFRLWAEVAEEVDSEGNAIWPASPGLVTNKALTKSDIIILFLKHFDIRAQKLSCIGYIYINKDKKVEDLVPIILKKMGWPDRAPNGDKMQLTLFEEIKPTMIEPMKAKQTLRAAELQDGDIVCFQLPPCDVKLDEGPNSKNGVNFNSKLGSLDQTQSEKTISTLTSLNTDPIRSSQDYIEDARFFYDWLSNKRDVLFSPHPTRNPNPDVYAPFTLTLSSKYSYDQMAARVGQHLRVDPTHIRFWTTHAATGAPKIAVKRVQSQNVTSILNPPYSSLSNATQKSDALFFEILEISLSELDTKRALKVNWLSEGISKVEEFDILVPKNGNVEDLIQALLKKAQLDDEETGGPIRVYETHSSRIYKVIGKEYQISSITDYVNVVAERLPAEDIKPNQAGNWVYAFHYQNEPSKTHGIPFIFRTIIFEKFSDTKKRLEKRTGFKGKVFEKIKFAIIARGSFAKPLYLNDDDILEEHLTHRDDMLGLDHVDRSRGVRNGAVDLFLK